MVLMDSEVHLQLEEALENQLMKAALQSQESDRKINLLHYLEIN